MSEWINEKSRIGDDPNNTEFESDRDMANWVRSVTHEIEEGGTYSLKVTSTTMKVFSCRSAGFCLKSWPES